MDITIHRYEEVESTNDTILDFAIDESSIGTIVTAEKQTIGRGRRGRKWSESNDGTSIMLSAIIGTDKTIQRLPDISFIAGIGVWCFLSKNFALEPKLKWVNDLVLSNKKIAGILIETVKKNNHTFLIAGIGVNINQESFSQELPNATSIYLKSNRKYDIKACENLLAKHLFDAVKLYNEQGFAGILDLYRKNMWGIGKKVEVICVDRKVCGIIIGIDDDGALLVRENSELVTIHAADEIKIVY